MSEPFLGQIILFAGNFAIRGFATCDGQLLPISQNTAVFSLLGTTYGGDGQSTFALPDLRGRVPVHVGQGPGLSNVNLGEAAGAEAVTLLTTQIPAHKHAIAASNGAANATQPGNNFPAAGGAYATASDSTTMNVAMNKNKGGGQPHENRQPYLGLNYLIALQGIFPSRN